MVAARFILLGPQRLEPTVREALTSLAVSGKPAGKGPIALITAGWEEREGEDQELVQALGCRCVNLKLHSRAADAFRRDRELFAAFERRYDRLQRLRELYRLRLDHALEAARALLSMPEEDELLAEERRAALEAVRSLDNHHVEHTKAFQTAFDEEHPLHERDVIIQHRREIDSILADCTALCIAGGHVGMLLNRLRIFGLAKWAAKLPIVAWSAGAMALSERVVLFHDSPPQGRVNAEVLEAGLGIFPRVVALPHAKRRLLLDDSLRVGLFSMRFGPELCAALDEGSRLDWIDDSWHGSSGTRHLLPDGSLAEVGQWS